MKQLIEMIKQYDSLADEVSNPCLMFGLFNILNMANSLVNQDGNGHGYGCGRDDGDGYGDGFGQGFGGDGTGSGNGINNGSGNGNGGGREDYRFHDNHRWW